MWLMTDIPHSFATTHYPIYCNPCKVATHQGRSSEQAARQSKKNSENSLKPSWHQVLLSGQTIR